MKKQKFGFVCVQGQPICIKPFKTELGHDLGLIQAFLIFYSDE